MQHYYFVIYRCSFCMPLDKIPCKVICAIRVPAGKPENGFHWFCLAKIIKEYPPHNFTLIFLLTLNEKFLNVFLTHLLNESATLVSTTGLVYSDSIISKPVSFKNHKTISSEK